MNDRVRRWVGGAAVLAALVSAGGAVAHDDRDRGEDSVSAVARRVSAGASLLRDHTRTRTSERLHERAHRFEQAVDDGSKRVVNEEWRALREAFERVRREASGRDPEAEFLVSHLAEDVARGDQLVGRSGDEWNDDAKRDTEPGVHPLVNGEICLGTRNVGPRPCPQPRESITFSVPRGIDILRQVNAEWRDFGRGAVAEVYINDRLVWSADVAKGWDPDGKRLDMRIWPGSTITLRTGNGEPFWVRKLDLEAGSDADRF